MNSAKAGYQIPSPQLKKELKMLEKSSISATVGTLFTTWLTIISFSVLSHLIFVINGFCLLSMVTYLISFFVISTRQRLLENIIHEATHFNLCKSFRLNDIMAWSFAALPLFHNLESERELHIKGHHVNFWNEKLDPDFIRYKNMGLDKLPAASYGELAKVLINAFPSYLLDLIPTFFLQKNQKIKYKILTLVYWSIVLNVFYNLNYFNIIFYYWLTPFVFGLTAIRFFAELSEHASLGCKNAFFSTRNNIGWFNENFIHPCGDGFHIIHHLFPKIPFYNVKKAHELLMNDDVYSKEATHCYSFIFSGKIYKSSLCSLVTNK